MQHAEHNLILGKLGEEIARVRTSVAYAEQGHNRASDPVEHQRTYEIIKQRRRELAYWYDLYQWAETHRKPTPESLVDADVNDEGPRPGWLYGPQRDSSVHPYGRADRLLSEKEHPKHD